VVEPTIEDYWDYLADHMKAHYVGPFRWRGHINWKDVAERVIAGCISGTFAGISFWLMVRLLGG